MRDYDEERRKTLKSVTTTYDDPVTGNSVTTRGPEKPYNALLSSIEDMSDSLNLCTQEIKTLFKIAWWLGMNGETHACEAIMSRYEYMKNYRIFW